MLCFRGFQAGSVHQVPLLLGGLSAWAGLLWPREGKAKKNKNILFYFCGIAQACWRLRLAGHSWKWQWAERCEVCFTLPNEKGWGWHQIGCLPSCPWCCCCLWYFSIRSDSAESPHTYTGQSQPHETSLSQECRAWMLRESSLQWPSSTQIKTMGSPKVVRVSGMGCSSQQAAQWASPWGAIGCFQRQVRLQILTDTVRITGSRGAGWSAQGSCFLR